METQQQRHECAYHKPFWSLRALALREPPSATFLKQQWFQVLLASLLFVLDVVIPSTSWGFLFFQILVSPWGAFGV